MVAEEKEHHEGRKRNENIEGKNSKKILLKYFERERGLHVEQLTFIAVRSVNVRAQVKILSVKIFNYMLEMITFCSFNF